MPSAPNSLTALVEKPVRTSSRLLAWRHPYPGDVPHMTLASSTASTAYPCPDTPKIVLFTLSLNMFCSPAGAVLCGTGLGLEYERPRRRRILRNGRGLACLPISLLIISFTMSRCHDAGSNPYLEGSQRVHSIIFLRICWPRIFFLPVDFRSNLPPKTAPHHPDEPAANRGVRPHQFARDGPYSLAFLALAAGNQDVPSLAGGRPFHHAANILPACAWKKSASP